MRVPLLRAARISILPSNTPTIQIDYYRHFEMTDTALLNGMSTRCTRSFGRM